MVIGVRKKNKGLGERPVGVGGLFYLRLSGPGRKVFMERCPLS